MKANSVIFGAKITPNPTNFRSQNVVHTPQNGHDEFVCTNKKQNNNKAWWTLGGAALLGIGAFLTHKAGWWGKAKLEKKADEILNIGEFKKVEEAKEYFEKLGIITDLRGATDEHLPLLNRIKENLEQLKEMGVKKEKPDSITISNWKNKTELEELHNKNGVNSSEYEPNYFAQCLTSKDKKHHIYINSNKTDFDMFRHEMGHVNDFSHDSLWHSKGKMGHDFADKQLQIVGQEETIYRGTRDFDNIFYFNPQQTNTSFTFPNKNMETRFVHAQNMISRMQSETGCYASESLIEQKAYIFEGLLQGKTFSDEVMLYYDFSGGARIPNLKIKGKTYDEYIESLYNNKDLIEKLQQNIKISKL